MNNRFAKYAAATVATVALTAAFAFAQNPHHAARAGAGRQAMLERGFARMAQHLGLTDTQKEQAKAVFEQARQQAEPLRVQMKQNREAIAQAVKAGKPDAELQSLAATSGTLMGQLTAIHLQAMSKVYATLTPDQKQKADQMHQQLKTRFQRFRGHQPAGE